MPTIAGWMLGSGCLCRFFLDNQPDAAFVMSAEDKQKIDQRAQRFGKGSEGNRNFRKKLSINELVKVVVSPTLLASGRVCVRAWLLWWLSHSEWRQPG